MRIVDICLLIGLALTWTLSIFAASPTPAPVINLKSKSFIGVFGFPSSGNIWMQEMLRFTDGVSTIHAACTAKNGANTNKICTKSEFSAFSQTSMGRKGSFDLKIELLCTIDPTPEVVEQTSKYLRDIVDKGYWDTQTSYFVESSTRLALRLPILRPAADIFGDQKYIISVKHPICVRGGFDSGSWVEAVAKNQSRDAYEEMLIMLDIDGVKSSHVHKETTLCQGYDSKSRGASWIQFMKSLHDELAADEQWSLKHVRIVRYEDFQSRPLQVCQNMFKFLFVESHDALRGQVTNKSSPYFWTETNIQQACRALFPAVKSSTSRRLRSSHPIRVHGSSPHHYSFSRHLKKYNRKPLMNDAYHLATSLNYNPDIINATCDYAMTQFQEAYHRFPEDIKRSFEELSQKMSPYGYSLNPDQLFTTEGSVLEKWNLMKH